MTRRDRTGRCPESFWRLRDELSWKTRMPKLNLTQEISDFLKTNEEDFLERIRRKQQMEQSEKRRSFFDEIR